MIQKQNIPPYYNFDGGGVKAVYTAVLTQTGTGAPVATVLQNTTGEKITWERFSTGRYRAVANAPIWDNSGKVFGGSLNGTAGGFIYGNWTTNEEYEIATLDEAGAFADEWLSETAIEIRIYH